MALEGQALSEDEDWPAESVGRALIGSSRPRLAETCRLVEGID